MTNKFRRQRPMQVPEDTNAREGITDLTKGILLDRQARLVPPGYSPSMDHIRFESEGLRKDFGSSIIGTAAAEKILAVGEFKYILNEASYHRLIRLRRSGVQLYVDIWNGSSWVQTSISTESIADVYLSIGSTQNRFLIADGQYLLTWYESASTTPAQDDFPSANSLTGEGDTTDATISPAGAVGDEYSIRYSVDLTITNGADYDITIALLHEGTEEMTEVFELASGSDSWLDQLFTLIKTIDDGDTLTLQVKDVAAGTRPTKSVNFAGGGTYDYEATKTQDDVDQSGIFNYNITLGPMIDDTDVAFYYDANDGGGWQLITTVTYIAPTGQGDHTESFNLGALPSGAKFAIDRTAGDGTLAPQTPGVDWEGLEESTDFSLDVHGYNDPTDSDPYPGVSYSVSAVPVPVLELLSADAPAARFILPFGDRLLAYRDGNDPQVASWSADGDITDWTGGDSGQTTLIDTRSDGIDDIMGAAALSSSVVAVFRKRSIMRAQETGNYQLAVGHFHWIEKLGTESPFSLQSTPAGVLFLGHDLMVYLLTESGPQPVGQAIQAELVKRLTSNLDLVDSAFDSVFGEYYLGIPEDNASTISGVWIFELATFLSRQEAVWRYRSMDVERFGEASVIE